MIKNTKKSKTIFSRPVIVETTATPAGRTPAQTTATAAPQRQPSPNHVLLEFVKPEAKNVCVAGSFNNWKPEQTPLTPAGNGRWVGSIAVSPGRHEYLFVADGQWLLDPKAREAVPNPFGGKNSVLLVAG